MIKRLKNGETIDINEVSGETETFDNDELSCREGMSQQTSIIDKRTSNR